ncbi:MAG TPA: FAD-dependent monooxygenase [Streptosporangiaceae bacterium]|nr:FAD-dependent monooxygenase [Streptosporangiaceae bacterium]
MDTTADVCVVGAGPAGLTLSLLLVRSGLSTVLVERSGSLAREYRGEILQPGGQRLLAQLGVLDGARERGSHELTGFQLRDGGRVLFDVDYRRLPPPYDRLLSIPQQHVLAELLERCHDYPGFTYLGGTRVSGLIREAGRVRGVTVHGDGGSRSIHAGWVVGADGRYSKVRRLADIGYDRLEVFSHDLLWFKVPAGDCAPATVQVVRGGGNPVLIHRSYPDQVQIGWSLPHGTYQQVTEVGVGAVADGVGRALPAYAATVRDCLTGLDKLSLLDVFAGEARQWAEPGLVLIGDAAHTHSPLGAQGINLAIQDAVALHPALVAEAAGEETGAVDRYIRARRRDIKSVLKFQVIQSRAMFSASPVADFIRPKAVAVLAHTPAYRHLTTKVAYGNAAITVHDGLFMAPAGRSAR